MNFEFGLVLQGGKIIASTEQKPVSLNDICWVVMLYRDRKDSKDIS